MPNLNPAYTTSLFRHFSTFVDQQALPDDVSRSALELWHTLVSHLSHLAQLREIEVESFLSHYPNHPAVTIISEFVRHHLPSQTSCALDEYLLALSSNDCSNSTIKNYRSDIKQFLTYAGSNQLDLAISKPKVQAFISFEQDKGLRPSSITRKLVSLTQFAFWAAQTGWLTRDVRWLESASVENLSKTSDTHQTREPYLAHYPQAGASHASARPLDPALGQRLNQYLALLAPQGKLGDGS